MCDPTFKNVTLEILTALSDLADRPLPAAEQRALSLALRVAEASGSLPPRFAERVARLHTFRDVVLLVGECQQ